MKFVYILLFLVITVYSLTAQTVGQLSVTATTVTYTGNYAPENIMAIWVQSKTGVYIKTLLAYAGTRRAYLSAWKTATASTYNVVDAITGATQGSHGVRVCTWNGANLTGTVLGDDTYNVIMEMTEGGNNKLLTVAIKKGSTQQIVTPANVAGFSNITVKWVPATTALENVQLSNLFNVFPNPAINSVFINGPEINEIQLLTLSGQYILSSKENRFDISFLKKGIYLALIKTTNGDFIKKISKE